MTVVVQVLGALLVVAGLALLFGPWALVAGGAVLLVGPELIEGVRHR